MTWKGPSKGRILEDHWAVVLCGGRGSRLGRISDEMPKPMVRVHDRPLIWYVVLNLYKQGFRRFIFPLGYKGEMIENYLRREFDEHDVEMRFFDTGTSTPIARRLAIATTIIPKGDDFLIINGDTFFDFDILSMFQLHRRRGAWLTLSSVKVVSSYGLILQDKNGNVVDFVREGRVDHFLVESGGEEYLGYVNAGIAWINKLALGMIDLDRSENFEQDLFPLLIRSGKDVAHYEIEGEWFAIDTPKDLDIVNLNVETKQNIGEVVKSAKADLTSRYQYRTRYFDDVNRLKEEIINKTVKPHQVEIQPGPVGGELCWLRCPYCYGNTATDSGERLAPQRYEEVLREIAEGGVNKLVFAGYATDPLNYRHIEDLHKIALEYGQIFGFHTKAIKVSDRLIEQITDSKIAPMSYFSVSVDAGTNETYNRYHGVPSSTARIYDRVRANLTRIAEARDRQGVPLDLSATYLLSPMNNSPDEVLKAIRELRDTGIDLIRFTFPQRPRGFSAEMEGYIPRRPQVVEDIRQLRALIEAESSAECQVLILDLDEDENIDKARTLPCFARFVFPSIGFDGWLSHCSESAAPHFREMALGDLNQRNFWDLYYDYDSEMLAGYFERYTELMNRLGCKCDRKEHVVNARIAESGIFNDFLP